MSKVETLLSVAASLRKIHALAVGEIVAPEAASLPIRAKQAPDARDGEDSANACRNRPENLGRAAFYIHNYLNWDATEEGADYWADVCMRLQEITRRARECSTPTNSLARLLPTSPEPGALPPGQRAVWRGGKLLTKCYCDMCKKNDHVQKIFYPSSTITLKSGELWTIPKPPIQP